MLNTCLEVLRDIEENGFESYIVGGFVRDYYMKKVSIDVDICTSARPKDLIRIFEEAELPKEKYGAVTLVYKNVRFEITTFRKEIEYLNRRPVELEYINDFMEDIYRRDFTINTLCMNSKGEIIDLINGKRDIDIRLIRVVGDANKKFKEDPLRILRAIRFATQLDFRLDKDTVNGIKNNMYSLKNLSYQRKKDELNKIFASRNVKYGLKLIRDLGLDYYLELNLNSIKVTSDVIGIWAQLDVLDIYPFSHLERTNIICINDILKDKKITKYELYRHGLYLCSIAAEILGINKRLIIKFNKKLPIRSKKDINITAIELCELLNKKEGKWIGNLYSDIETKILEFKLENDNKKIREYIINNN